MAIQAEPFQVGQALVVEGTVRVESTNGIIRVIEPNSQIFLDDQIATGSSGAVSIVLSDGDGTQLDLGRMSQLIVDEDVMGGIPPDLGDVAIETDLATVLLQSWEAFEPLAPIDSIVPDTGESLVEDSGAADSIAGLDNSPETLASSDSNDDGVGSIDDELDMANFIPPPEDAS
ncbi:MAG: hypothetical protein KJO28_06855 [Desulfofustis sp.]|nr:hypothetical protein [Desulfofustis sp.]